MSKEEKGPDVTVYYRVEIKVSGRWQTHRGNLTEAEAREELAHPGPWADYYSFRGVKITKEIMER